MLQEILIVTISLFAIVDPIAAVPVFISTFGGADRKKRRKAAIDAVLAAFALLVVFALIGMPLLNYLNISISAFMIAGGLLLLFLAFEFLLGQLPKSRTVESEPGDAVVPIGTPLLAGPGAITSVIFFTHLYGFTITFVATIIVMVICLAAFLMSHKLERVIGKNGLKIITRIMGLITAAIAISFIEKAFIGYGILHAVAPMI
ncbi:MAG: MarC family protein [Candidatus Aenigmarchaeota archaeon]|nr:MarC family protein [Candidatus Aenigmarchaeota archaeon]